MGMFTGLNIGNAPKVIQIPRGRYFVVCTGADTSPTKKNTEIEGTTFKFQISGPEGNDQIGKFTPTKWYRIYKSAEEFAAHAASDKKAADRNLYEFRLLCDAFGFTPEQYDTVESDDFVGRQALASIWYKGADDMYGNIIPERPKTEGMIDHTGGNVPVITGVNSVAPGSVDVENPFENSGLDEFKIEIPVD